MSRIHEKDGYLTTASYPPPFSPAIPSPATTNHPSASGSKISPAVLFIIVILAVLFFISGLLHLLVRFLVKHPSPSSSSPSPETTGNADFPTSEALQRQLQQLFHLHDSGLDQAFIDALPVFHYTEIVGLKEPFDCAVCLCEFSDKDRLRLLPVCSHAFHISCIDTWLLSNSTCPLCRGALFANPADNPVFDFEGFGEDEDEQEEAERERSKARSKRVVEIVVAEKATKKGVLPVRLGKFRRVGPDSGETSGSSSSRLDARRCFSMGSYEYVLGDSVLRVPLRRREERSEGVDGDSEGKKISSVSKGESFSVSKIWLWPKKGKFSTSSSMEPNSGLDLAWMGKPPFE